MKSNLNESQTKFIEMQKQFLIDNSYIDNICGNYISEYNDTFNTITYTFASTISFDNFNVGPSLRLFVEVCEQGVVKCLETAEEFEQSWIHKIPVEDFISGKAFKRIQMFRKIFEKVN